MKWIEPEIIIPGEELLDAFQNSIFITDLLTKRGLTRLETVNKFLYPEHYSHTSTLEFPDMQKAISRIMRAIQVGEKIGIWGDFDVDGQTSTAILFDGLKKFGANCDFHIPVRKVESHGILKEKLIEFLKKGIQLLITCDTGITEYDALQYAEQIGLDVIISDHHSLPEIMPPAFSILNPRVFPESHPFYHLAGVGTAFQIIRGLNEVFSGNDRSQEYYDLVALGTIADLAMLRDENRFYTQLGLRRMNSAPRPAFQAMQNAAGESSSLLNESVISFTFSPRLNAIGRLENANPNVTFLLENDPIKCEQHAEKLERINDKRKMETENVYSSALELLKSNPELSTYPVLLLARKGWEPGVVGIAANKLADKFNKPAVLLIIEEARAFGSARSIEGVDIIRAIEKNKAYLHKFGGHPMAAGLSMAAERIEEFRQALSNTIQESIERKVLEKRLEIDLYLPLANIHTKLVEEVNTLSPFGHGNPAPVLVSPTLEIVKNSPFGHSGQHQTFTVRDVEGETRKVVWWNCSDQQFPTEKFDLAFTIKPNHFKNKEGFMLEWIDFRECEREIIPVKPSLRKIRFRDFRTSKEQKLVIDTLMTTENAQLWGEGIGLPISNGVLNRGKLVRGEVLGILTPPPSQDILTHLLEIVQPRHMVFFNFFQPDDRLEPFLNHLSGLIKFCINNKNGRGTLEEFAAAMNQTIQNIKLGLQWWEKKGSIHNTFNGIEVTICLSNQKPSSDMRAITDDLQKALLETAAYRSYYRRVNPEMLLKI